MPQYGCELSNLATNSYSCVPHLWGLSNKPMGITWDNFPIAPAQRPRHGIGPRFDQKRLVIFSATESIVLRKCQMFIRKHNKYRGSNS